jgi:N-acetylmuramic acid 6-phosphate etherase
VQYVIAGGAKALGAAVEANEDSAAGGRADLAKRKPTARDVVVGISASGRTPYTVGALRYAATRSATTIAVTCNLHSALERAAHIAIVVPVGPEALTGSTRLKAGTAQKMVLNMLSTGAMARLGYVYGNLMINVPLKNSKLSARGIEVLQLATGLDRKRSLQLLRATQGNVPLAVVMAKRKVDRARAVQILAQARGHIRRALAEK